MKTNAPSRPFCLGDRVQITSLSDDCGDESFLGQSGEVVEISDYCDSPFYSVLLPDGRKDGFYAEELTAI